MDYLRNKEWGNREVHMLSPLQLAYVGDSVYEVFVRTQLLENKKNKVSQLHRLATHYVKAEAQANILASIEDQLTEEEQMIVRRGRNAKSNTTPKNAKLADYKNATALECLVGFLYLEKRDERLKELLNIMITI